MSQYNLTKCGTGVTYVYLLQPMFGHGQMFNMRLPWIQTPIEEEIWIWVKLETTDSIQLRENDDKTFLPFKDPHPAFKKKIFKGRSSVNPPQHTYTTWYKVHTELFLDLKILLASETLDENFKFHTELKYEERKQILLSFVAVAGTSRFKMTSTTHGPSEASADGLGLPNTSSADGVRYSSAAHGHNLIQAGTCTELFLDLKILLASQTLDENFKFHTELKDDEQKQILLSFPLWQ